jgi:MFS family permease
MAVFLAALDTTIITTALPTISTHFKSSAGYTWIGSAYLLGAAASTPVWAKFSDIFGRKPMLMVANAAFFVGSLVAAQSFSIGMLIAARGIQGVGGGGLISLVNISIGDLFSMRSRGFYYGMVGLVWASECFKKYCCSGLTISQLPELLDHFWVESSQRRSRGDGVSTLISRSKE